MSQAGSLSGGGGGGTLNTLTANSGGAVSPTLGNINVVGDGTTIDIVGNPGTSTLTASYIGPTPSDPKTGFWAILTNHAFNVTGDGTVYTLVCDNVQFDNGSGYNNTTGEYTAPQAGFYLITVNLYMNGFVADNTDYLVSINSPSSGNNQQWLSAGNPYVVSNSGGAVFLSFSAILSLSPFNNITITIEVFGDASPNVTVLGNTLSLPLKTAFSAILMTT